MTICKKVQEFFKNKSKTPWAKFETAGVDENGLVRYDMTWNPAFLENLRRAGFTGHNEQEIVENFFLGSMIIPKMEEETEMLPDEELTPAISEKNRIKK